VFGAARPRARSLGATGSARTSKAVARNTRYEEHRRSGRPSVCDAKVAPFSADFDKRGRYREEAATAKDRLESCRTYSPFIAGQAVGTGHSSAKASGLRGTFLRVRARLSRLPQSHGWWRGVKGSQVQILSARPRNRLRPAETRVGGGSGFEATHHLFTVYWAIPSRPREPQRMPEGHGVAVVSVGDLGHGRLSSPAPAVGVAVGVEQHLGHLGVAVVCLDHLAP
jgi:hypothetical protein